MSKEEASHHALLPPFSYHGKPSTHIAKELKYATSAS